MERLEVRYRPEAIRDIEEIYLHIYRLSRNPETVHQLVRRLLERCGRIGNAPRGGRPREDLQPGLRIVPFEGKAVIAYRLEADAVQITNVFYGGRDFEALYRGQAPDEA